MRKKDRRDRDDTDRWIVSYADFITLLFAFFTTMYAISQVDAGKLEEFAGSMKSAFNSGPSARGDSLAVFEGFSRAYPDPAALRRSSGRSSAPSRRKKT